MIELAVRPPLQLTPSQTVVVVVVAAAILLAVLATGLLEGALIACVSLFLRLIGHRPPRRSSFSTVLDEFEARVEGRREKDE